MKRFIIRSLIYLSPLLLVFLVTYLVDPYYLFHKDRAFNDQKYEIGYFYDQGRRYKIFTFWNNPTDKIILGASEINIINEHNIPEEGWHSLSYGGAPLQESLQMYWEVSKEHHLKKVIIAPEFIKYYNAITSSTGDSYYADFKWETSQSAKALEIYAKKLEYFIDKYTLKSLWLFLYNQIRPQYSRSKPKDSKEVFWKHQLNYAHGSYSGVISNKHKLKVLSSFREIKEDADSKGTEIIIVIPLQHIDLLKEEFQDSIFEEYVDYIRSLTDIFGGIYYLAYIDGVSEDTGAFTDPFHFSSPKPYIDSLFGVNKMNKLGAEDVYIHLNNIKKQLYNNE